mgnify:CR=1 FL=1
MSKIVPLVVRCSNGQPLYGVDFGGQFLYRHLLSRKYDFPKWLEVKNKTFNDFPKGLEEVKNKTYSIFNDNQIPLVLGGDHSVSYGSIKAALKHFNNNIHVLWIDSHTDINSLKESKTKNRHGMVVSSLMNLNDEVWGENEEILLPEQITYFGINDTDQFEEELINELNINYIGRDEILKKAIHEMIPENTPLYVSFDVDVIDKQFVSCTGTPVDRGLEPEIVNFVLNHFKEQIIGMDIVEFNPFIGTIDDTSTSMNSIEKAVKSFLDYNVILDDE